MAKESWLEDNETHAQNFLTAVTKAIKYVNETDENTVAEYLKPYFEGTEKAALAASVKRYKNIDAWVTNMAMTEDSFTRLQDVIDNAGELEKRVAFTDLIETSYANTVYGEVYG
jgi:NitT/TauT family transport system substrate-binding protein